jgi:LmbE family N-acetylglucosaminyl deacetylase
VTDSPGPTIVRSPADATVLGTVLGVWAHPDDEAYLSAALMAFAVDAGSRVAVVTATLGEHGTPEPSRLPPHVLREIRADEHRAALAVLGVHEAHLLGYEDGTCEAVPEAEAVARIATIIDEIRPDTIVTFGPDGMTGHPDHRAVSAWATAAASAAGFAGRLLYATQTESWVERFRDVHDRVPIFGPEGPPSTPEDRVALWVDPTDEVLDRKVHALGAHTSQTSGLIDGFGGPLYREWVRDEWFVEAGPNGSTPHETGSGPR